MNIQALGQLVIKRKKIEISEDDIQKRRQELEQQKELIKKEAKRLAALLHGSPNERKDTDAYSFIETYGTLSFFREYIQEGHKGLVRAAFMKGELKSYQKGEFITIKGDKNQSMKVILEGQVGLYMEMADLKTKRRQLVLVRKMFAGESLEMGTLIENGNYVMTTQALTDKVEIMSLEIQHFMNSFSRYEVEKYEADLEFLRGVPFFKDWPKRNLNALQMCLNKFSVAKSQVIFQEGQTSHALFIVKKGEFGLYKKRQTWMKGSSLNHLSDETAQDKLKQLENTSKDLFGNDLLAKSASDTPVASSKLIPTETNIPQSTTLFQGKSKLDVTKKISGFLTTSAVEMNSDLVQTLTEFDSFGEQELLDGGSRQCSVVCRSQTGELIQIKRKHFFVLAQEDPSLKYSIMTKMMIEAKKQQLQAMRYNFSFRNENQLSILDNQLQCMGNVQQFKEKFNVFKDKNSNDLSILESNTENDNSIITQLPQNLSLIGSNNSSSAGVLPRARKPQAKSFQISKLHINPSSTDDTKINIAQLYYQMSKTKRENAQTQKFVGPSTSATSLQNHSFEQNPLQSEQHTLVDPNSNEQQSKNNLKIQKNRIHNSNTQSTRMQTDPSFNKSNNNTDSSQLISNSTQIYSSHQQSLQTPFSFQEKLPSFSSQQTATPLNKIENTSWIRSDLSQKTQSGQKNSLFSGQIKSPSIGCLPTIKGNSKDTTTTSTVGTKNIQRLILPQTGSFSSFFDKTQTHGYQEYQQQFSSQLERTPQSSHVKGQNSNFYVKRSFILETEPMQDREHNSEVISGKINRFPVDSASLPSRDFSSRPLINSIGYSKLQLKI